tara:strand:+ start:47 stop:442 length:396 start_codon:yes stop_codon:yes gene_type:complete
LRFDQLIWNETFFNEKDTKYNNQNIINLKNKLEKINLKIDIPENNNIYVFGGGIYKNYAYVNDQFFIHNNSLVNTLTKFYKELPSIIDDTLNTFYPNYGCWIEHFFTKFLINHNIKIRRSILSGIFIREFD